MKKEIRVLGIDDSPFDKFKKKDIPVIGVVFRGGQFLDGILSTKIRVDGNNSTQCLIEMINKCKFKSQLQCIILDGIAMGGFNVVDVKELSKKTKIPVMVVIRNNPNFKKIFRTLRRLGWEKKIKIIEKAGEVIKIGRIYVQLTNLNKKQAEEILKITCTRSYLPEPIRVAHLIAAGIVKGESSGGA